VQIWPASEAKSTPCSDMPLVVEVKTPWDSMTIGSRHWSGGADNVKILQLLVVSRVSSKNMISEERAKRCAQTDTLRKWANLDLALGVFNMNAAI